MEQFDPFELNSFIDDNGYVKSYIVRHPFANAGYVPLHRLVMEQFVQFWLSPDIVVHHIDENKQNNKLTNLFITTHSEHVAIHNRNSRYDLETRQHISSGMKKYRHAKKLKPPGQ